MRKFFSKFLFFLDDGFPYGLAGVGARDTCVSEKNPLECVVRNSFICVFCILISWSSQLQSYSLAGISGCLTTILQLLESQSFHSLRDRPLPEYNSSSRKRHQFTAAGRSYTRYRHVSDDQDYDDDNDDVVDAHLCSCLLLKMITSFHITKIQEKEKRGWYICTCGTLLSKIPDVSCDMRTSVSRTCSTYTFNQQVDLVTGKYLLHFVRVEPPWNSLCGGVHGTLRELVITLWE